MIKPSRNQNLIEEFWTYTSGINSEQFNVLPDNCCDIIFDLTNNSAFLSGVMTQFEVRSLESHTHILGIRMKAEYANLLLEIPQVETKNLRIDLSLVLPSLRTSTTEQLQAQTTYQQQVQFLENWIREIVNSRYSREDHLVVSISKSIRRLKGLVNISTLAKDNYISLRQLERRIKNATGLTLKEYSNTVRFNIAAKAIKQYPEQDISEIAFNHGFHDLAHMSNTFKRISGQSPSTFR